MKNSIIAAFEKKKFEKEPELPSFRSGDTVRVHYKIRESGDASKFRIQAFEGVVIRYKKGSVDASFTVRKMGANGIGVERTFPVYSSNVEKVDLLAAGIVRRSRLFYLRNLTGKAARIRSRYTPRASK